MSELEQRILESKLDIFRDQWDPHVKRIEINNITESHVSVKVTFTDGRWSEKIDKSFVKACALAYETALKEEVEIPIRSAKRARTPSDEMLKTLSEII